MNFFKKLNKELKDQKLFRDNWFLVLLFLLVSGLIFLVIWSLTHIHVTDIDVPIRFTSLTNFDELGKWYQLYEIPAIAIIVSIINVFFATLLHKKNRIISIFLIITALMVVILAIAILLGFTAIKYGS
ncbi:MAG: hypothetical protein U0516_04270 [Candidatus Saccharibacteria bacterium]